MYSIIISGSVLNSNTINYPFMKKNERFWICVDPGSLLDLKNPSMSKRYLEKVRVGAVEMTMKGQEPKVYGSEVWKEITREGYEERLAHPEEVFCYDGFHCIGCCFDCALFEGLRPVVMTGFGRKRHAMVRKCTATDLLYGWNESADYEWLHSCCIKK